MAWDDYGDSVAGHGLAGGSGGAGVSGHSGQPLVGSGLSAWNGAAGFPRSAVEIGGVGQVQAQVVEGYVLAGGVGVKARPDFGEPVGVGRGVAELRGDQFGALVA